MNEGKKDRRDPIRTIKARNPVAKNANAAIGGGAAGAHKDKKKAMKQGEVKHKNAEYAENLQAKFDVALLEEFDSPEYNDEAGMATSNLLTLARAVKGLHDTIDEDDNLPEWCQEKIAKAEMMLVSVWDYMLSQKAQGIDPKVGESRYDRRDAYQRDYDSSVAGMGKRQSYAYQQDGGANDEYNTPEYDPELQRNRQETMMYNVTVDGKPVTPKPLLGRSAAIAWAKEQIAAGKLDPKTAKLSPVRYDQDVTEGAKVDRQAKHITTSMMKKGKSKKDAEAIAWAHIKHPKKKKAEEDVAEDNDPCWKDYKQIGMKKKGGKKVPNCVPKEGWTHDSLAAQLFETENTYEDKLSNLLNKRLGK